jgi:hypothetical protein
MIDAFQLRLSKSRRVTIDPMLRRAFNLVAALSLGLFLATAGMWVRSHWHTDEFHIWKRYYVDSQQGSVLLLGPRQVTFPAPPGTLPPATMVTVKFMTSLARCYYVTIVCWSGAPAYFWLLAFAIRRQRKLQTGHFCLHCGYDLRASPERCPECGEARKKWPEPTAIPK